MGGDPRGKAERELEPLVDKLGPHVAEKGSHSLPLMASIADQLTAESVTFCRALREKTVELGDHR